MSEVPSVVAAFLVVFLCFSRSLKRFGVVHNVSMFPTFEDFDKVTVRTQNLAEVLPPWDFTS